MSMRNLLLLFGYTKIILNILTQTARTSDSTYNIDNVRLINVIFVGPIIKPSNRPNLKLLRRHCNARLWTRMPATVMAAAAAAAVTAAAIGRLSVVQRACLTGKLQSHAVVPSVQIRFIMRPSSLGGGRILRRTLSVCLSVCPSVPFADVLCLQLHRLTSEHPK